MQTSSAAVSESETTLTFYDLPFVEVKEGAINFWNVKPSSERDPVRAYTLDASRGRAYGRLFIRFLRCNEDQELMLSRIAGNMTPETSAVQVGFWTEIAGQVSRG